MIATAAHQHIDPIAQGGVVAGSAGHYVAAIVYCAFRLQICAKVVVGVASLKRRRRDFDMFC